MAKHRQPRVGIDIGKVIIEPVKGGAGDTTFRRGDMAKAMETPPSPGALEGVAALVEATTGQAWLISKAGPKMQAKTKRWLKHWDFYGRTGLHPEASEVLPRAFAKGRSLPAAQDHAFH